MVSPINSNSPFLSLNQQEKKECISIVRTKYIDISLSEYTKDCTDALLFLGGKYKDISQRASTILEQLNQRAEEKLNQKANISKKEAVVSAWNQEYPTIVNLTFYVQLAGKAFGVAGILSVGVGFYYFRSNRLIGFACTCAACVYFIFQFSFKKLKQTALHLQSIIRQLNVNNLDGFSGEVEDKYALLYSDILLGPYFKAQNRCGVKGLDLLTQQVAAAHYVDLVIRLIILNLTGENKNPNQQALIEILLPPHLMEIKSFFIRFQKLFQSFQDHIALVGTASCIWTCYTYAQKAYLLFGASLVQLVFLIFVVKEIDIIQKGAKRIVEKLNSKEIGCANKEFEQMARYSSLVSSMGLQKASWSQIREKAVVPIDKILNLIPEWNRLRTERV